MKGMPLGTQEMIGGIRPVPGVIPVLAGQHGASRRGHRAGDARGQAMGPLPGPPCAPIRPALWLSEPPGLSAALMCIAHAARRSDEEVNRM